MWSAQRRAHVDAEVGEHRRQPLVRDVARPASHFRGAVLGRWACQAQHAWRLAAGPARRGVLLPSPRHAGTASQRVARPMPPFCVVRPMSPFHVVQPPPLSAAGSLPPVNSKRQRASILPNSKYMLPYAESACCKHMFQLFQLFQRYVASASYGCCKSRSGCCTCCKSMFQMFLVVCCSKCFYVASVFL
jgi:hypothetical protein